MPEFVEREKIIKMHRVIQAVQPIRMMVSADKTTDVVTISCSDEDLIKFFGDARHYLGERMGWGSTPTFRLEGSGPNEIKFVVQPTEQPLAHDPDPTAEQ